MEMKFDSGIGAVIIGRNEGERLKRCLASVQAQIGTVVYVDSGSSDGSAEYAAGLGVLVVELDMSVPFNAGRARNEGFSRLRDSGRLPAYVQFIDGDCELCEGWARNAKEFLAGNPGYAIVAGRVKERCPEKSIYNELCDSEWNKPSGDTDSCGGIFMADFKAFSDVGGFNPGLIAGEEPELCFRLRKAGWKVRILDALMTLHDADMTRFSQWWKRTVRTGYGYTSRYFLKLEGDDSSTRRAMIRISAWSVGLPLFILVAMAAIGPWALLLLSAYLFQLYRSYRFKFSVTHSPGASFRYALFNVLGKWPQFVGQLTFVFKRFFGKKTAIIEYK